MCSLSILIFLISLRISVSPKGDLVITKGSTLTLAINPNSILNIYNYLGADVCYSDTSPLSSECIYKTFSNSSGSFASFHNVAFYNGGIYTVTGNQDEKMHVLVIGSPTLQCEANNSPMIVETVSNSISCSLKFNKQPKGDHNPSFSSRFSLAGVDLDYTYKTVNTEDTFTTIEYEIQVRRFGRQHSHGIFNCQFSVSFGTAVKFLDCNDHFHLNAKPLLLRIVDHKYSADAVEFRCETDGNHYPTDISFTWFLNGQPLRPKLLTEAGDDVVIGYTTFSHRRNLTCVGRNSVGSSSISFTFNLPPHDVKTPNLESKAPMVFKITSVATVVMIILLGIYLKFVVKPSPPRDREQQSFIRNAQN